MNVLLCVVLLLIGGNSATKPRAAADRDSYLDAYQEVQKKPTNDRKGYGFEPPYQQYGAPYPPSAHYGPMYGPIYGSTEPLAGYPPPSTNFGFPYGMFNIVDKILLKLDLFTIFKIILKLVIFKKIVSFIAILCLLLFIPKLKLNSESRLINSKNQVNANHNTLTIVWNAIDKYSAKEKVTCKNSECNISKMFSDINKKYSYPRLFSMYATEIM